jgi:nitrate reductase gamma subunit
MNVIFPLFAVIALGLIGYLGGQARGLNYLFGLVIPYAAILIFIIGFVRRIVKWARSPVPFAIPTTCGQQKSLSWIKQSKLENPVTKGQALVRMALEILLFRSLFKNTQVEKHGPKLAYGSEKALWLAALAFHYCFLVIVLRHLRFFTEPVLPLVHALEFGDGFLEVGLPRLYQTGVIIILALGYLLYRRLANPQVKYISLPADYFPLFLILGIAITGVLMRYFFKVDVVGVKELAMGLAKFKFVVPKGIGGIFYAHLFLVCTLLVYFPYSKLMHLGGVFMTPTRNLPNTNRIVRYINPWNYPVKVHSYEEYEDDFREKMIECGLPVDKAPEGAPAEEDTPAE